MGELRILRDRILTLSNFLPSDIFERGVQQEPVVQFAGFPSEVDRGKSENASGGEEQSRLPATAGVSRLCFVFP